VPPRVEYELTDITRQLDPIINELQAWGERHKAMMQLKSGAYEHEVEKVVSPQMP